MVGQVPGTAGLVKSAPPFARSRRQHQSVFLHRAGMVLCPDHPRLTTADQARRRIGLRAETADSAQGSTDPAARRVSAGIALNGVPAGLQLR
jgi:hypothetical protein